MKSFISIAILVLLALAACKEKERLPIDRETLVGVLIDVQSAEAAIVHLTGEEKDSIATLYYRQIMEIHGVSQTDFDTCVAILRRNPELAESIYRKMEDRIKEKSKAFE